MILKGSRSVTQTHDNPLLIKLTIANCEISHVQVDTKNFTDVMFYECFINLSLQNKYMSPTS